MSAAPKNRSGVDDRYRSLLQKAVRRGHPEIVYATSALIETQGLHFHDWFEKRVALIVLNECWPLFREMSFGKRFSSKVAALIQIAFTQKVRDATGLGSLAYALAQGDGSALDQAPNPYAVKLIAKAIKHPADYWEWVSSQNADPGCQNLVANAARFREGSRPHDKAVVQAAAYLAVSMPLPNPTSAPATATAFPYWTVFDRHTVEGQRAFRDVARDLRMAQPQLEWCCYFFEGAAANGEMESPWWQRYCDWRFERVGIRKEEAFLLWTPARGQLIAALAEDGRRLQADIYRWKLANLERVEELKREVERFARRLKEVPRDQTHLF
jgi:hypothetical protein